MASDNLAEHRLSESITQYYLPRLAAVAEREPEDLALELVREGTRILYERIELPLKPVDPGTSLLWARLFPFVVGIVGKWPILATKFEVIPELEVELELE
ncbi:hypothetical protein D3C85_1384230 [compost metagenome]